MSFANIRSLIEVAVANAYGALTPAVPVIYQNVQEEPPGGADCEYVIVSLSYPQLTEAIICPSVCDDNGNSLGYCSGVDPSSRT